MTQNIAGGLMQAPETCGCVANALNAYTRGHGGCTLQTGADAIKDNYNHPCPSDVSTNAPSPSTNTTRSRGVSPSSESSVSILAGVENVYHSNQGIYKPSPANSSSMSTPQPDFDENPTNPTPSTDPKLCVPELSSDSQPLGAHLQVDELDESESEEGDLSDENISDWDDEWSGEDGGLEERVISAVNGNLPFAASIIPIIHRFIKSRLRTKVETWQSGAGTGSQSSSSNAKGDSSSRQEAGSAIPESLKRKRVVSRSTEESEEPEEGGSEGEGRDKDQPSNTATSSEALPLLACPFFKHNPAKYSVVGSPGRKYRCCQGPGFKSIQRLREHLKRVHYPVQCERCGVTFKGDRATAITQRSEHNVKEIPCPLQPKSLEGISDGQWAKLEAQGKKIKNQEAHRIAKWIEIWRILFPGEDDSTPWYDSTTANHVLPAAKWTEDFVRIVMEVAEENPDQRLIDPEAWNASRAVIENAMLACYKLLLESQIPVPGASSSFRSNINDISLSGSVPSTHLTSVSSASNQKSSPPANPIPSLDRGSGSGYHSKQKRRRQNDGISQPKPETVSRSPHQTQMSNALQTARLGHMVSTFPSMGGVLHQQPTQHLPMGDNYSVQPPEWVPPPYGQDILMAGMNTQFQDQSSWPTYGPEFQLEGNGF